MDLPLATLSQKQLEFIETARLSGSKKVDDFRRLHQLPIVTNEKREEIREKASNFVKTINGCYRTESGDARTNSTEPIYQFQNNLNEYLFSGLIPNGLFDPLISLPEFIVRANTLTTELNLIHDIYNHYGIKTLLNWMDALITNVIDSTKKGLGDFLQGTINDAFAISSGYLYSPVFCNFSDISSSEFSVEKTIPLPFKKATCVSKGIDIYERTIDLNQNLLKFLRSIFPPSRVEEARRIISDTPIYAVDNKDCQNAHGYQFYDIAHLSNQMADDLSHGSQFALSVVVHELIHKVFSQILKISSEGNNYIDYQSQIPGQGITSNNQASEVVAYAISFWIDPTRTLKELLSPINRENLEYARVVNLVDSSIIEFLGWDSANQIMNEFQNSDKSLSDLVIEKVVASGKEQDFVDKMLEKFINESKNLIGHRLKQLR